MPIFITSSTKAARWRQGTQAREEQGFPSGKMQTVLQMVGSGSNSTASVRSRPLSSVLTDGNAAKLMPHALSRQKKCKKRNKCSRIPAQILRVHIQNASSGDSGWGGCPQVMGLKQKPHGRCEGHSLVAGQGQHLHEQMWSLPGAGCHRESTAANRPPRLVLSLVGQLQVDSS